MAKTAILLGATGLTGGLLLEKLLDSNQYSEVKVFTRSKMALSHPKLKQFVCDVVNIDQQIESFKADVVFCCIGTTAKKTPDKEIYRSIDFGIPVKAASLSKLNDVQQFLVISAMGANTSSRFFYNKVKGQMEQAVLNEHIPFTLILRPSLIRGKRVEKRFGEDFANWLFSLVQPFFIGPLAKYKAIEASRIAECMYKLSLSPTSTSIVPSNQIEQLASGH